MKCHEGFEVKYSFTHIAMWVTALWAEINAAAQEKNHTKLLLPSQECMRHTHTFLEFTSHTCVGRTYRCLQASPSIIDASIKDIFLKHDPAHASDTQTHIHANT